MWCEIACSDDLPILFLRLLKLTPNDLRDLCWEKGEFYKYQHYHNYLCSELLRRAFEKHGGPSGLQFARV